MEKQEQEVTCSKGPEGAAKDKAGIQPTQKINFKGHECRGWTFQHSMQGMSSEKEMDQWSDKVGIMGLPEVFYGSNHLFVSNKEHNILLHFNAIDSLSFSGYQKRTNLKSSYALGTDDSLDFLKETSEEKKDDEKDASADEPKTEVAAVTIDMEKLMLQQSGLRDDEKSLNLIDLIAPSVQVEMSKHWKDKDTSKIKDFKTVTQTSDWTFTTPYKGTTKYLSQAAQSIFDQTGLNLSVGKKDVGHLRVEQTTDEIPFGMLGQENPIMHYGESWLFEADLEDCGYMMSKVRFRVMGDCFYVLLRYYLRVDGVLVRICDTRIFHAFGEKHIHREFQYREATYDHLKKVGFDLSSEWLLNPAADDMVFPNLPQKHVTNDKIFFE